MTAQATSIGSSTFSCTPPMSQKPVGAAPSEVARYSPMKKAPVSSPHCWPNE